ncbi:hypothetical protein EC957_003870 [Mortierella hygrophila]|uniref:dolichyl-phosphate-mannose--protein mannosyltransferase n=1 Tax=Mortierella hygrophila TaxID=979708 RepID=A0A9P6F2Z3_9FUNG|nr:hypothetical protein EC957_003870 [Mortierella hygrophila]
MAKKHNSSKKSKQKNDNQGGVSIASPAVFSPQDESIPPPTKENNSGGGLLCSISFASSHASLTSLIDLDHEPSRPWAEAKQQFPSSEKTKKPSPAVIARQSCLSQKQRQSQEAEGDDLWSWITATHPSVSPRSAPTSLDPDSKHQHQHDDDGTQEKEEKKQAKSLWYETQQQESLRFRGRDWVTLSALTGATMSVRLWRMDASPAEVVLDEAYIGKYVNGYLNKAFTYDIHPPLGKMILAGISSLSGKYDGSFPFEEVGDTFDNKVPFLAMRTAMAVMGALCAPMAYITLRNKGQSAPTAILASLLVAFDNVLVANNRLMSLEAPLMFFTALSFMSWTMFTKRPQRLFGVQWWLWLLMTGLAAGGAMLTKLPGVLTVITMGILAGWDLWGLIADESVSSTQWVMHCVSRFTTLAVLPVIVYTSIYYLHFQLQSNQPYYATSVHGDYDLTLLTPPFRHSLQSPYTEDRQEPVWSDIVFGSVIQLQSESQPPMYVHSPFKHWPKGSKQIQVAAYEYPDLSNHWIVVRANLSNVPDVEGVETKGVFGDIPERLEYVYHGDWIRLRHVAHRHCMHSHDVRTMGRINNKRHCEVSAYGLAANDFDGDRGDWWRVEIVNTDLMRTVSKKAQGLRVKALETAFRLRHYSQHCHLHLTGDLLEDSVPGGEGRVELSCLKDAAVLSSSIWRFSMNDHDYLPVETELASYPKVSFWKKFKELHSLIRTTPRAFDMNKAVDERTDSSRPMSWVLKPFGSSILLAWRSKVEESEMVDEGKGRGHVRQISLVPNPASWVIRSVGLVLFLGFHVLLVLRYQRGYSDGQDLLAFKQHHLSNARTFFSAWAFHFLPFLFLNTTTYPSIRLNYRDYFPALYFSILLACTLLSGIMRLSTMSRITRAGMYLSLSLIAISAFIQLSPLTYGTLMSPEKCATLATKINPKIPDSGYAGVAKGTPIPLIQPTLKLTCMTWSQHLSTTPFPPTNTSAPKTFSEFKSRTELHFPKPIPRKRSPVLESIFPDKEMALPMEKVFMTPCQRPPQLWEVNEQKGEPGAFVKQQMQFIFRRIEKEAAEKRALEEEGVKQRRKIEAEAKEEKAKAEKVRVEREQIEMARLEKERVEKELQEKDAAEKEQRRYQEELKVLLAEQSHLQQIEAEKQRKAEAAAEELQKEAEAMEAAHKAQQEEEESECRRLHRQKVAFDAAAKAAEVAAASKVAEHAENEKKVCEQEQKEQTNVKAGEQLTSKPSRQEFREAFFKRAEKMRLEKLDQGFKFKRGDANESIPKEMRMVAALISVVGELGGVGGARGNHGGAAGLGALFGGLGEFGEMCKQGFSQQQQQKKYHIGARSAAKPAKRIKKALPAKPARQAQKAPPPVGNVESVEDLITVLQQAQKDADSKPAPAPAPHHRQHQQQPSIPRELLNEIAGLEKLTNDGEASPEEL